MMFHKILIANRGEIACRIIRTVQQMGIEAIAVYSMTDREGLHVSLADRAFFIGEPPASASYLNIDNIIATAIACGAEAIHPGYGFLSENPQMARACAQNNIVFIGPTVAAMEAMASKQVAKQLLEKTGVPLTPGYHGNDQSDETLLKAAKQLGFPVLLKAASGGGGKGMRSVFEEAHFLKDLAGARREARASFADDTMLIEKLVQNPRHIEVQIMADNHGNVVHLYERDCSIQRRHQKIIEEAPAPHLSTTMRKHLTDAAIAVAQAIDYRGAGTVEFLVDNDDHFYFMEMNTRLQVEHPVTEMITKLDLVEWQLRIAANEQLPLSQDHIQKHGHAIECRIYAEDPSQNFIPSMGCIDFLKEPMGEGIRLDTGMTLNSHITMHYDPMIAKLIAYGDHREQAIQRLQRALKAYHIGGVTTNITFLQTIIQQPSFLSAQLSTDFLNQHSIIAPTPDVRSALMMAASFDYLEITASQHDAVQQDTFSWQMHLSSHWIWHYLINDTQYDITVIPINPCELQLILDHETTVLTVKRTDQSLYLDDGKKNWHAWVKNSNDQLIFYTTLGPITVIRFCKKEGHHHQRPKNQLTAPMPATVVAILKNKGDAIKAGDRLMVLEAMKMEHTIHAPSDGLLMDIFYEIGAQVKEGAELIAIHKKGT
jgi:3-methylcrotonyl-CoA carboxylase alpha subunit